MDHDEITNKRIRRIAKDHALLQNLATCVSKLWELFMRNITRSIARGTALFSLSASAMLSSAPVDRHLRHHAGRDGDMACCCLPADGLGDDKGRLRFDAR